MANSISFNLTGLDPGIRAIAEAVAQIYVTARTTQSQEIRDYWDARMAEVDYQLRAAAIDAGIWKGLPAVDEAYKKLGKKE